MRNRSFGAIGLACLLAAALAAGGCASGYGWRPTVPSHLRTVCVPTFRNESDVAELGAVASRQLLRELQREGTFGIRRTGDAALEVQGVVKAAASETVAYDRHGRNISAHDFTAKVEVSVIDKTSRRVLIDGKTYVAHATFTADQDRTTSMRNAAGRLMDDFARQVVNDLLNLK